MLRIVIRTDDASLAANVGGAVETNYRTIDIDAPEVENFLRAAQEKDCQYLQRQIVGAELKDSPMTIYPIIFNGDMPPKERHDWPLPSFDAKDWAEAFCKLNPSMDQNTMLTWFSAALMRGYDEHAARSLKYE